MTDVLEIRRRQDGVAVLVFDDPQRPLNLLYPDLIDDFDRTFAELLDEPEVRACVLVSGKESSFIVGADVHVLDGMETAEEASAFSRRGNALLRRLEQSPKPVVAAVHGTCVGGGLEVALACHAIVATEHPDTVLALPEVQLGLLPGGGGTQRLPRRIGLAAALPLMLTGKSIRVREALRLGLVDRAATPGELTELAARTALTLEKTGAPPFPRRTRAHRTAAWLGNRRPGRDVVMKRARKEVERKTRGLYPAPEAILDCAETGLARGLDAGLECEARRFGELVVDRRTKQLIGLFHAGRALSRVPEGTRPGEVNRVAVLGAGFMGAGIASVSLPRAEVVIRDVSEDALEGAASSIEEGLDKQLKSGAVTRLERDRRRSRLTLTKEVRRISHADLVIEAVFEDLDLKQRVLAEVEDMVGEEVVIASNTSALPISRIAESARHPERILGMHYFSPVHKMPLLELVVTPYTSDRARDTALAFGVAQGKTVIVVKDGPGFYTTRILAPLLNEAMLLLEEGISIRDIDGAMMGYGFPVGPLALVDEVGLDVGAHVAKETASRLDRSSGEISGLLLRLVDSGCRGRKNGRGFYLYPEKSRLRHRNKEPNPEVYEMLGTGSLSAVETRGAKERGPVLSSEEIQDRMVLQMANEAIWCLQEEVIAGPRDGDVGAVLGLGFPPFRGGPFRWADAEGTARVAGRLERLADRAGERFKPAPMLQEMASGGRAFHPI